jgi:hypothetical protein
MDIKKLMELTEQIINDSENDVELVVKDVEIGREKAKLFDATLTQNEDFIFEACGGEMRDAKPEEKAAVFKVLCDLNEIYYIQDQMEMPN